MPRDEDMKVTLRLKVSERKIEEGEIMFCEDCRRGWISPPIFKIQKSGVMLCPFNGHRSRLAELSDVLNEEEAALFTGRLALCRGIVGQMGLPSLGPKRWTWSFNGVWEGPPDLELLPLSYSPDPVVIRCPTPDGGLVILHEVPVSQGEGAGGWAGEGIYPMKSTCLEGQDGATGPNGEPGGKGGKLKRLEDGDNALSRYASGGISPEMKIEMMPGSGGVAQGPGGDLAIWPGTASPDPHCPECRCDRRCEDHAEDCPAAPIFRRFPDPENAEGAAFLKGRLEMIRIMGERRRKNAGKPDQFKNDAWWAEFARNLCV